MNLNFNFRRFLLVAAAIFLTANLTWAEDTNVTGAATRGETIQNYLRLQEQIHTTQMAIQQSQINASLAAKANADLLAERMQSLEKSVATQHAADAEAARKTQQLTLFLVGVFGLAGLGIMLLMVYFQWRAFTQLAQISTAQHPAIAQVNGGVHELAAPGRAVVESSNTRLLDVVGQLEKRIHELEDSQRLLPEISPVKPAATVKPADSLTEAQKFFDANQPQPALDYLEKMLANQPENADALVKKAVALEKLGRTDEALSCCDRAIALDGTLALAHLHKGGLLNRLRRYDEALNCYESALQAQEKKATALAKRGVS